ncbi:MAG: DUF4190 domain-containing protein [Clostridia bacterium]|nr:DUF4190 domain-containing protein [Clostridia bacterium]
MDNNQNNVYYDLDNDNKNDDFLKQERQNEQSQREQDTTINIPHYQQPEQPVQPENSGLAIASLVLGILSLVCCGSFLFSILAIVFYFVDKSNTGVSNKLAKIGMILGIVSIAVSVLFIIVSFVISFSSYFEMLSSL